jgi:flagellar biosynthesis anti-sigma factor FlgM
MKIEGRKNYGVGPLGPVQIGNLAPTEKAPDAAATNGDSIEISTPSRELVGLRETTAAIPEIRMEKVEGIREQVEDGSYYVESDKLAKRVVDEALQDALRRHSTVKREHPE